jgi:hypothetical protein
MASEEEINIPILEGRTEADSVRRSKKHHKPLSLLPLVALIFYDVSGGPFGIEVPPTLASLCLTFRWQPCALNDRGGSLVAACCMRWTEGFL